MVEPRCDCDAVGSRAAICEKMIHAGGVITPQYDGIEAARRRSDRKTAPWVLPAIWLAAGVTVLRIEGPGEEIPGDVLAERCAARKALRPPWC